MSGEWHASQFALLKVCTELGGDGIDPTSCLGQEGATRLKVYEESSRCTLGL